MSSVQSTFLVIILAAFPASTLAQSAPGIEWQKSFGGNGLDIAKSVKQTSDGGYIIGGDSFSNVSGNKTNAGFGGSDYWLVNVDANGSKQWDRSYGGSGFDQFSSLQQTTDGGYILGGTSPHGASGNKTDPGFRYNDYWVVKVDSLGNKQWDKCYGGVLAFMYGDDGLSCLQQTSDGGYILGGYSDSPVSGNKTNAGFGSYDFWLVKIDSNGSKQWDKSFGGSGADFLFSMQQTSDGGYILGGISSSSVSGNKTSALFGSNDFWVVKTDLNGNKQWDKSFGGSHDDVLQSLQQTSDGGYILAGYSFSGVTGNKTSANFGSNDYWVVKIDANGNKQWDQSFGGSGSEGIGGVVQTSDGGYILGGGSDSGVSGNKTTPSFGWGDCWMVKTDAGGNKLWERSYGGNNDDEIRSLQLTTDAGYILAGFSQSGISGNKTNASFGNGDYWIVKLITPLQIHMFSLSATNAEAQLYGIPGTNYIFQASTNLTNWTSLATNVAATNGIVTFTDTNMGFPQRFFRAQQKP